MFGRKLTAKLKRAYTQLWLPGVAKVEGEYAHTIRSDMLAKERLNQDALDKGIFHFRCVYFVHVELNPNYLSWLQNQIGLLPDSVDLYLVALVDKDNEASFKAAVQELARERSGETHTECHNELDSFEYRGVHKAWALGQEFPGDNDIVLYFHAKGVSRDESYVEGTKWDSILCEFSRIKDAFSLFPDVNRAGWFAGGKGWIWYNYWFARGSYLNKLECPIKTDRRHYYEDWLCREYKVEQFPKAEHPMTLEYYRFTPADCYSIGMTPNIGYTYHANGKKVLPYEL